jgi:hypothetical protein
MSNKLIYLQILHEIVKLFKALATEDSAEPKDEELLRKEDEIRKDLKDWK